MSDNEQEREQQQENGEEQGQELGQGQTGQRRGRLVVDGPRLELDLAALIQTAHLRPVVPVRQSREERIAAMTDSSGWNEGIGNEMRGRFNRWRARRLGIEDIDDEDDSGEDDDEDDDDEDYDDVPELIDYEEEEMHDIQAIRYETTDERLRRIAVEDLSEVVAVVVIVVLSLRGVVLF